MADAKRFAITHFDYEMPPGETFYWDEMDADEVERLMKEGHKKRLADARENQLQGIQNYNYQSGVLSFDTNYNQHRVFWKANERDIIFSLGTGIYGDYFHQVIENDTGGCGYFAV